MNTIRRPRLLARPLAALLALSVAAACEAQEPTPNPTDLLPGTGSTIPFEYVDHIFIPTEVDTELGEGLEAMLLYDPVRGVYLDSRFVRQHGLPDYGGEEVGYGGPVYAGGAGSQQHRVTFVRGLAVRFSGLQRDVPLAPVIPLDSMMAGSLGRSVDGLFGTNLLHDYVVEMDFEASRFVLHDPAAFEPPDGATVVPIQWTERTQRPTVPLTLHLADGEEVQGRFLLDFGMGGAFRATTGFTDAHDLTGRITPNAASDREAGLGGALQSVLARPPAISIGTMRVERPLLSLARETSGADAFPDDHEGLIGLGFLDRYRVFYDAPGSRLVLAATERSQAPFPYVVTGLTMEPFGGPASWPTVAHVEAGSPAAAAGLQTGDVIVRARGRDTRGWTKRAWRAMLAEPPHPIPLHVRRSGQEHARSLLPSYPLD